jgi:hypothetical protein
MVSAAKKAYRRQFGFPAVTAGRLAGGTVEKKSHEVKGEGWIYRYAYHTISENSIIVYF